MPRAVACPDKFKGTATASEIAAAIAAAAEARGWNCDQVPVADGGEGTLEALGALGGVRALEPHRRLRGVDVVVACDVDTRFVDAAESFAPQKGATQAQVYLLRRRLERLAQVYEQDFGVDVRDIAGSGAAGGLAGGLAALGAVLVPGFAVVADALSLAERFEGADLVVTGEGFVDEQSFR